MLKKINKLVDDKVYNHAEKAEIDQVKSDPEKVQSSISELKEFVKMSLKGYCDA